MKTQKLITLAILAALAAAGYVFYTRYLTTEAERSMSKFNQALQIWINKITKAHQTLTPGWEAWYIPPGPSRDAALRRVREAALYQIEQNQPELIPPGYQIIDTGNQLALLQKL